MAPHQQYPGVPHLGFDQISKLNYKEQSIWMLNGFWNELASEGDTIWRWTKLFAELDNHAAVPRGANGSELDQVLAAKFLERTEQTLTAKERKAALREIDVNNDGKMALVEYLLFRFGMSVEQVANAKQGHAQELAACQAIIDQAMAMLPEVQANLAAQRAAQVEHTAALAAVREAKVSAAAALTAQSCAEAELRTALESASAARAELAEAVAALEAQEQALLDEMCRLRAIVADSAAGVVSRGRAANNLNGLENEDPLPLRKAKITAEAALRKLQKREDVAAKRADEAAEQTVKCEAKVAELAEREAEGVRKAADLAAAVAELEQSYAELSAKMEEARAAIEELKLQKCGLGAVWWMERELFEADESLPRSRQKYDHSKPLVFDAASAGTMLAGLPEVESSTDGAAVVMQLDGATSTSTSTSTSTCAATAPTAAAAAAAAIIARSCVTINVGDAGSEHGMLGFKMSPSAKGSSNGSPTVKAIGADGPADGKLAVGDTIVEINGVATAGLDPLAIGDLLHGTPASSITFTIVSSTGGSEVVEANEAAAAATVQPKVSAQNIELMASAISG